MRAVAVPMADPQLEFHWIPDPGFLIQDFLIQCLHRACGPARGVKLFALPWASWPVGASRAVQALFGLAPSSALHGRLRASLQKKMPPPYWARKEEGEGEGDEEATARATWRTERTARRSRRTTTRRRNARTRTKRTRGSARRNAEDADDDGGQQEASGEGRRIRRGSW